MSDLFFLVHRSNNLINSHIFQVNKPTTSGQPVRRNLRKRTIDNASKPTKWEVTGMSNSGSDFSPDGSEDEYLPPASLQMPVTQRRSLRGFMRYQEVTRQRGGLHIAGGSNDLIGISSRGQVSGRRRRGRPLGPSGVGRSVMLEEHRRIVQGLHEADSMSVPADLPLERGRNIPQLNDGTSMNDFWQ